MTDKPKALDLSTLIRHAFFTGAGYGDLEKITDEDLKRFAEYDPTDLKQYERIVNACYPECAK